MAAPAVSWNNVCLVTSSGQVAMAETPAKGLYCGDRRTLQVSAQGVR